MPTCVLEKRRVSKTIPRREGGVASFTTLAPRLDEDKEDIVADASAEEAGQLGSDTAAAAAAFVDGVSVDDDNEGDQAKDEKKEKTKKKQMKNILSCINATILYFCFLMFLNNLIMNHN